MSASVTPESGAPPPALARGIDSLLGTAASLMLLALMGVTCVDVLGRYLFDRPLPGGIELTELILGALIFTSLPLVTQKRQHVRVDMIELLPAGWRNSQQAIADLLSAACIAVVGWQMWIKAGAMAQSGETSASLQLAIYPLVYFMALLTFATAVLTVMLAWTDARGARKLPEMKP